MLSLSINSPVHAASWLVDQHEWEHYHEVTYYQTDEYFDQSGNRQNQPNYRKLEHAYRTEYGFSPELTLGFENRIASVRSTTQLSPSLRYEGWNYGIADPKLFARHLIWKNNHTITSAQATLKFPSLFNSSTLARSGTEDFSYELRGLAGHNYEWLNQFHFANLELAYELRPQNDADLIHIDATAGFQINQSLMLMPQLFTSWRTDTNNNAFSQTPDDSYNLMKAQLSSVYEILPSIYLQTGLSRPIAGKNTGAGWAINLGLWIK